MHNFREQTDGKDTFSGGIVGFHLIAPVEHEERTDLWHVRLTTDTGPFVYLKSTKEDLAKLMARGGRTATFVGDFLNDEKKHFGCDSIFFWAEESE